MTYANNHPLLPALGSGIDDNGPARPIVIGDPLDEQDIMDARFQHTTRKHLNNIKEELATGAEVIQSKQRKILIEAENLAPGGNVALANAIAGLNDRLTTMNNNMNTSIATMHDSIATLNTNMNTSIAALNTNMNNGFTEVNNRFTEVDNRFNEVDDRLKTLSYRMDGETARNINRTLVRTTADATVAVPNNEGNPPPNWLIGITLDNVMSLAVAPHNQQGINDVLTFYGIPTDGTKAQKIAAVKNILGITIWKTKNMLDAKLADGEVKNEASITTL